MPDWLTEAVRPKPAPVPWGAMVRAALAICVPLSVGIVAGRRDIWLLLAVGGLTGTVIDTGGPYVVRVKRAVIAGVCGGAAGLVIGMLIHDRGWVAVASLVVVAGVSALISRLGSTASVTGLQLLVFTSLGLGPFGALRPWWHIVPGLRRRVAWALLLLVPGWLLSPRSAEQGAVAHVYHALADDLRAIGTDRTAETRRAVTAALNTAYDTLLSARATAGGRSRRMTHLMAVLNASSRVAEAVVTLRREGTRPPPLVAGTLDRLADAIAAGGPLPGGPLRRGPRGDGRQGDKQQSDGRDEDGANGGGRNAGGPRTAHQQSPEPRTACRRSRRRGRPALALSSCGMPWRPSRARSRGRPPRRPGRRRGYRCASAPGPCSAPCSTSFGADGSHGPSPSG